MSLADLQLLRPAFWLFYSGQNPIPSDQRLDAWLSRDGGAEILSIKREWLKATRLSVLSPSYYTVERAVNTTARPAANPTSNEQASENNLLKNADFALGTEFWDVSPKAPGIEVVRDPQHRHRWVLKIPTADGIFALSQQLIWSSSVQTVSGDFQVSVVDAAKDRPVQIRVRFYDAKGNSRIVAGRTITTTHRWHSVVIPRQQLPETMHDKFLIESNRGQGNMFIGPVFLTAQTDEAARTRYVAKLAELHDELTILGRNPGDPALPHIESEIRSNPAPPETDSGTVSQRLVGTWSARSDAYEYRADGTWSMISAGQNAAKGEWHIDGNQFVETRGEKRVGGEARNSTIVLVNDEDFVLADAERVFHATRIAPIDVEKIAGLAIPDLRSEQKKEAKWPEFVKPEQLHTLESTRDYMAEVHKQLGKERQAPGGTEFKSVLGLLKAPSLPLSEKDLIGQRRFRSIDITKVGVFPYTFHNCRFTLKDGTWSFERPRGYAVVARKGNLYRHDESTFVFIGSRTLYDAVGRTAPSRDSVGVLLKKAKDRFIMILDPSASMYELYEIKK